MLRLLISAILVSASVAGCGDVIVFGHVVHERAASPTKSDAPPADASAPAVKSDAPPADVSAPAVKSDAPPADVSAPVAKSDAPPADVSAPAAKSDMPPVAASPPVGTSEAPPAVASARVAPTLASPPAQAQTAPANTQPSTVHTVRAVNVSLAPAAKVAGDSNFGLDALTAAIKSELRARRLLSEQNPNGSGSVVVTIDGMTSHPTSNAVFFGYQMMAGTLTGDIRVDGATGNELPDFRIIAASRWNVVVAGDDKNPLKPLYHRFARLVGDRLAGVTSEDDSPVKQDSH